MEAEPCTMTLRNGTEESVVEVPCSDAPKARDDGGIVIMHSDCPGWDWGGSGRAPRKLVQASNQPLAERLPYETHITLTPPGKSGD